MDKKPLYVLQVEDSASDAALVARLLRQAGYDVREERVEDAAGMQAALDRQAWDVIIADFALPQFNAPAALALLQQTGLDIPFIVVSGTIGEEVAVAMMRAGAHDYLMKDKLLRLAPAVERELREAQSRRERRQTEEALRASEARFSTIFRASPVAIVLTRLSDNQLMDVNEAWQAITGYARAEVIGHTPFELNLWVNPARRQRLTETLRAQGTARDEVQIRRKSGEISDVLMSVEAIEVAGERYLLTMAQDITERKQAEETLHQNEERLRLITENMSDTVWLMDMDLQTIFISPSVERLRGYTLAELQALPLDKQLTPPSLAQAMTMMAQELTPTRLADKNARIVVTVELEFYRKNGSTFWSENSFTVIRNMEGRPVATLGVGRDITDRKQAEAQLAEQLDELRRWHSTTLGREGRVLELKCEVNQLLRRLHEPIRYPSAEALVGQT